MRSTRRMFRVLLGGRVILFLGVTSALLLSLSVGRASGQVGTWATKAPMPTPLFAHSAASVGGTLYMVGGDVGPGCPAPTTDTLAYDVAISL